MSYTSKQFLLFDNSTDANFRSWGSAISAAIASMGWVSNGDSGQVNWTTVTSPAAGSFVYECWKPSDAGTTFVLKVEYGSSSGATKGARIRMTVATASDGAGNLTGLISNTMEPGPSNAVGTGVVTYDCYFSGDVDRISMLLWRGFSTMSIIFSIERTHNADGTNSNDGVTLVAVAAVGSSPQSTVGQQTVVFGVAVGINSGTGSGGGTYLAFYNGINGSSAFNNNIPISPIFPEYGKYGNPLTTIGFVHTQDVAEACFFTTTLYGATRTYIATGQWRGTPASANNKICMRYD